MVPVHMKEGKEWLSPGKQETPHVKRRCAHGGTGKVLSIMNCLNETKLSTQNSMFNRWNDSKRIFKIKDLIGSMEFF